MKESARAHDAAASPEESCAEIAGCLRWSRSGREICLDTLPDTLELRVVRLRGGVHALVEIGSIIARAEVDHGDLGAPGFDKEAFAEGGEPRFGDVVARHEGDG